MRLGFVQRRLLQGLIVVAGATTLVFIASRMVGDPVAAMLPLDVSVEERQRLTALLGLDKPYALQFLDYISSLAVGDFGVSYWQQRPAGEVILERLPASLMLGALGVAIAVVLGVASGVIAAARPGGMVDHALTSISLIGLSIPQFWLALLLIMIFAVNLGWVPTSGVGTFSHMILPAATLALPALGRIATVTRASMLEELDSPHIKTAWAKGMPYKRVLLRHALRNIGVPVFSIVGFELTRALSGYNIVVETIFGWPGIGQLALQAIERSDLILIQAVVFVIAIIVVAMNLVVDLVLKLIDPRIEY